MATTHTDVYRPFKGELARHPLRFVPLFLSELEVATKKKLPLLLLFGPPAIATIVVSVFVYAKFALQQGLGQTGPSSIQGLQLSLAAGMASSMLEVRVMIITVNAAMSGFALLAITWFGSGLVCEDRRAKAHLLYFSRPLTRLDYFTAKFLVAAVFGALAVLVPDLVICTMAVLTSPDYAFLREQGDVIWNSLAYGVLWVVTMATLVLAVSSLAPKKVFAMAGVFAFLMFSHGVVGVAEGVGDVPYVQYLSLAWNLGVIGGWMFAAPDVPAPENLAECFGGIGLLLALALLVIARRLRRMELAS